MQHLKEGNLESYKSSLVQVCSLSETHFLVFYTPAQEIILPHRITVRIKLHSEGKALRVLSRRKLK